MLEEECAVFIYRSCKRRQGGVWAEQDVNAFDCDGMCSGEVGYEEVAAME